MTTLVPDTPSAPALRRAVSAAFESAQIPWLKALVEIPSYTLTPPDVEVAMDFLVAEAEGVLGMSYERVPSADARFADHAIFRTRAAAAGEPAIALVGHVDTVFPRSHGFLEFWREAGDLGPNDTLRGPGVLDMKGGLSVIFFALRALRDQLGDAWFQAQPLQVVVVSEEERGSPDSARLWPTLAPTMRGALVFEAGRDEDQIVVARKGTGTFELEVTGVAAHAGNYHADGVNAIHAASLLVPAIEALTDYARGVTVNVGVIEGGTSKNTVPGRCLITVDARIQAVEDEAPLVDALREIAARTTLPGATTELSGRMMRTPMEPTAATQDLRLAYEPHAAALGFGIGAAPLQGGGSDANLIAAAGVPCIDGLGPFGKGFHKKSEWCSADTLRRRTQALATFLGLRGWDVA